MKKNNLKKYGFIIILILTVFAICFWVTKYNKKDMKNMQIETSTNDEVMFANNYTKAQEQLKNLSLEEKIGQLFLARYPEQNQIEELKKYKFGGYILFEKDFKGKTEEEIKNEISKLKEVSDIPLLIAVDEEGGKVVRVSSNQNLAKEKYKSPSELYEIGGFDKVREDTLEKSKFLYNLGINFNLAPVVDVSTNKNDYIFQRTLGKDTDLTSHYAKSVIEASKEGKVSYTLKHFPGYASNKDTHNGISIDNKSYEEIMEKNLPPFIKGIEAGAEVVMVSHNIVTSIDSDNPASLSKNVHDLLNNELGFTGITITDDLDMGAISKIDNAVEKAVLAGNDLIIVTDYAGAIEAVKNAVEEGKISEEIIDKHTTKLLAWKYYKFD